MSDVLGGIEQAYEGRERVSVEVPEWGCTLWFQKHLTLLERKILRTGIKADDEAGMIINFLIHRAENEDGSPVFEASATTRATLEGKADVTVLLRIMQEIGAPTSVDEAKND